MHVLRYLQVITFILFAATAYPSAAEMASVKGSNVNLRNEPSTNSTVKWEYGHGFPLKILAVDGDWAKVADFEKDTGWIHKSLLSDTPYVIVNSFKNSNRSVNIRQDPTTSSKIVGKAYYGVVFQVLEQKPEWVKIKHESGLTGWIYAKLIWGL